MSQLWSTLLYQPLVNGLIFFYRFFGNNLGWAIVALTALVRLLVMPLMKPQLEAAKTMQTLAPELENLKKKHRGDKQKLDQAQMELYNNAGVNPAAGCLTQIIQYLVLIALFQAFNQVLRPDGTEVITKLNQILYPLLRLPVSESLNLKFLWLDLSRPDVIKLPSMPALPGIFLISSAVLQFMSAKMMSPQTKMLAEESKKTETKTDDFSSAMQTQMVYMIPLTTLLLGLSFPSGLVIYWFLFSFFSIIQQYSVNGWGGLANLQIKKIFKKD
mgnify:CR=1 FL=1